MPIYEVQIDGQTFDIEAPDDEGLRVAAERLRAKLSGGATAQDKSDSVDWANVGRGNEAPQKVDERSYWERAKGIPAAIYEQATGTQRRGDVVIDDNGTPIQANTENFRDWQEMPEVGAFSNFLSPSKATATAKTSIGTIMTSPEETAQIVKANFPQVEIRQDNKGNFWYKSAEKDAQGNDQWFIDSPGFRVRDIPRLAALAAGGRLFGAVGTAAGAGELGVTAQKAAQAVDRAGKAGALGRAATVAGAGAAEQAALEASQAATGGQFNPEEVAMAGMISPVVDRAISGAGKAVGRAFSREGTPNTRSTTADIERFKEVRDKLATSPKAQEEMAQMLKANPRLIDDAAELGIDLPMSALTSDAQAQKLLSANESIQGSPAQQQGMEKVLAARDRVQDLAERFGAKPLDTVSELGKTAQEQRLRNLKEADIQAWNELHGVIPKTQKIPTDNVVEAISKMGAEYGGDLPKPFKEIQSRLLKPNPERLELERALNQAISEGNQGVANTIREVVDQMPKYEPLTFHSVRALKEEIAQIYEGSSKYTATPTQAGEAKVLESALRQDLKGAAELYGARDILDISNRLHGERMDLEKAVNKGFGGTKFEGGVEQSRTGSVSGKLKSGLNVLASSGDSKALYEALNALPKEQRKDALFSTIFDSVNARRIGGEDRFVFDFNKFADLSGKLMNKPSEYMKLRKVLSTEQGEFMEALFRVSKGVSDAAAQRINTGAIKPITDVLQRESRMAQIRKAAMSGLGHGGAAALVGGVLDAAFGTSGIFKTIGASVGATYGATRKLVSDPARLRAVTDVLNSQEFKNLAKAAALKGEVPTRKLLDHVVFSKPFRALSKSITSIPKVPAEARQWIVDTIRRGTTISATKATKPEEKK